MRVRTLRLLAIWLGCLSSLGVLLLFLALTDFYHGEADLSLEWMVVRFAIPAIVAFHVAAFTALAAERTVGVKRHAPSPAAGQRQ